VTRYRMRMLGDQSGPWPHEFDTPEEIAALALTELRAMRCLFIIRAVEADGTEREPSHEETKRFQAAMRAPGRYGNPGGG